ncbi:MAG: glycosyltransferase family 2 protein [Bacilli bacterium]
MKLISIVIPMYNEEEMLPLLLKELDKVTNELCDYNFEFVCVNDGSLDNTLSLLKEYQEKDKRIVIVNLSRNFGHENALYAGLKTVKGDAIIPMDADLQDPPHVIIDLVKTYEQGFDVVNAKRTSRKKDTFFKRNSAGLFYKTVNKLSKKVKIPSNVANFRLIDRRVLDEILKLKENNRVFRVQVPFVGFKVAEVYFSRPKRLKGQSKYNVKAMTNLAVSSIVSLTTRPLLWSFYWLAILVAIFLLSSIANLTIYILGLTNVFTTNSTFYICMMIWLAINILLLISSIIMLSLSIISIYLSKAVLESESRPCVIIDEVIRKE